MKVYETAAEAIAATLAQGYSRHAIRAVRAFGGWIVEHNEPANV